MTPVSWNCPIRFVEERRKGRQPHFGLLALKNIRRFPLTIEGQRASAEERHAFAERGATLIEAVLFTVIALGLVIGGIVFFEQASMSARTNDAVRMMASLQSQVRALFQSQATFGTSEVSDLLISANAVPSSMQSDSDNDGDNDEIVNSFGGAVEVTGATKQFTIKMSKVPVDVCTRMAPFDDMGNGVIGTGIAKISDGTDDDSDGLSAADAATFCGTNATGGIVDLTWTFNR